MNGKYVDYIHLHVNALFNDLTKGMKGARSGPANPAIAKAILTLLISIQTCWRMSAHAQYQI